MGVPTYVYVGTFELSTVNGKVYFWLRTASTTAVSIGTASSPITNNTWHYVVGNWDGSNIYIYVDGILGGSIAATTIYSSDTYRVIIGMWSNANPPVGGDGGYFKGSIDDIRLYNAAMPVSQIKEQYFSGLNSLLANSSIDTREYSQRINSIAEKWKN